MDTVPIKALRLSPLDRGARFLRRMCDRLNIPTKSISLVWGLVVVEWAIGIYLVVNYLLPSRISADQFLYVYQPILWGSLALLAWVGWRFGLRDRPKPVFSLSFTAILIALCQIAALAIAGLLLGFGHSPYDHELGAILRNLLYLGTVLVSLEMTRAYLVTRFKHRYPWISFILVSLLMTTLRIAPATFGRLDSLQSSIQIVGERLLPALTQSILATLLAMLGGPLASILYLGTLQLFEWLSPILPNPGWFVMAFIGTVIPAYGMVIVYNQYIAEPEEGEQSEGQETGSFGSWAVVAVFLLVLVGFSTGLFGVRPSLIGSGSMTPNIMLGDIVIAREVPIESVRVGDVITFQQEGVIIVHRVIDIQNNAGKVTFITQGDANDSSDPPVLQQFYKGKVVFTIPKIGWISIFVRNTLVKIL
jgi:signal peptidase